MTKRLTALAALALALCLVLGGCRRSGDTQAFWRTNFMGVWEFSGGYASGKEMSDQQVSQLRDRGMDAFLVMNERGTCRMNIFGVPLGNGTWVALDATEAELTFTLVEEEEEEEGEQEDEKKDEKGSRKLITADDEDEEESEEEPTEKAVEETRVVKIIHHVYEDQLCLQIDENTEIRFSPTTSAAMNEYLDMKADGSVSEQYADGFVALDALMAMSW